MFCRVWVTYFCVNYLMFTFEISLKSVNPHTAKSAFYEVFKVWWIKISQSYDILSLTDTGPRLPAWTPRIESLHLYTQDYGWFTARTHGVVSI